MIPIVADENVPASIIRLLRATGHEVVSVAETAPAASDSEVLTMVANGQLLLTLDRDFGLLAARGGISDQAGIVLLRFGTLNTETLARITVDQFRAGDTGIGHFTVIEPHRIRRMPLFSLRAKLRKD